ncbi:GNAT family N-acetyltransferase [Enterovibrio calviensis]|uniref:GNAT family N-acetyltransferase n=1 Tax=Enterovibrio calviensis TaxID=91359 RepID=UPI0004825A79|nr:GNAT family N-acetyltransferase [Enterovibrio calviensis]
MDVSLTKATSDDIPFLLTLRQLTMNQYLEEAGMPTTEEGHLSRIQYKLDCANIINANGVPVGLFKAEFQKEHDQWFIIQIQVHPDYQNQGIGNTVIERLLSTASESASRVRLSVIKTNPARDLYTRMGFESVEESDCEFTMEYNMVNSR